MKDGRAAEKWAEGEHQKEDSTEETTRDTRLFYTMLLRTYSIVCSHNNLRAHGKPVRKTLVHANKYFVYVSGKIHL